MRQIDFTNTQVASSETARNINRGVVLNLIRKRQPISRADLARVSGLQRSTVSLITEQLIGEKWVVYGPTGRLPRGRRPTFLRLNDRRSILVADLRPTEITLAVADVNGRFLSHEAIPTPQNPRAAVAELSARMCHLMKIHSELVFEGIGISVPGRFDPVNHNIVFAPNLHWPQCDLKGPLEKATGLRVELENAANACVLAEVWFGQGEKLRDLVVVTVSEGVGTGIFSNGQLVRGRNGMAGEFGHVALDPNGPECTCGGRGCWEVYASNRAALRDYYESSASPNGPTFHDLLSLADAGDALAIRALEKMAHAIGRGMRMLVAGVAPEEIVLVGEFTRQWKRLGPIIEAEVAAGSLIGNAPRVRPAAAEPGMARLRGTVALVLQKHFGPSGHTSPPLGSRSGGRVLVRTS
jgi:predicted NBD/HSP70 family sugar kinase